MTTFIEQVGERLQIAARMTNLDDSVRLLQDALGIATGDVAGIHFSGDIRVPHLGEDFTADDAWPLLTAGQRRDHLEAYLRTEEAFADPDAARAGLPVLEGDEPFTEPLSSILDTSTWDESTGTVRKDADGSLIVSIDSHTPGRRP